MEARELAAVQGLGEKQRGHVLMAYEQRAKKTSTSYICMVLFGVHYFYLGKPLLNLLYWFTGAGFVIWGIIDLFRMSSLVRGVNAQIVNQLVQEARILYPDEGGAAPTVSDDAAEAGSADGDAVETADATETTETTKERNASDTQA